MFSKVFFSWGCLRQDCDVKGNDTCESEKLALKCEKNINLPINFYTSNWHKFLQPVKITLDVYFFITLYYIISPLYDPGEEDLLDFSRLLAFEEDKRNVTQIFEICFGMIRKYCEQRRK